jgi:7,8-dihydropterin-6-yl-methyl-4-(beta-D-ribofuranosyl)aminobenzene 5'-phosphate synthase
MGSPDWRIAVLVDNHRGDTNLEVEHGLSFWVEHGPHSILFDTGQGAALAPNAAIMGIDLGKAQAIALSHGHYDHSGGLPSAWIGHPRPPLYFHPQALIPRYAVRPEGAKEIGMPEAVRRLVESQGGRHQASTRPAEIFPGAWLTGEIPRIHKEESMGHEPFYLDAHGDSRDPFLDDQALFFQTPNGVVVLLGCAHAGVINTLDHIRELTHGTPLLAVLGGMHLRSATTEHVRWTTDQLHRLNPSKIVPMHCTGDLAFRALAEAFGARVETGGAGRVFHFIDPSN